MHHLSIHLLNLAGLGQILTAATLWGAPLTSSLRSFTLDLLAPCTLVADLFADQNGAQGGDGLAARLDVAARPTQPAAEAGSALVFFRVAPTCDGAWQVQP